MNVEPNEIKSIDVVGKLYNEDVKMIITKGGLHIFVGKKSPYSSKLEALSASSHPALGLYHLEKDFKPHFEPILAKSENAEPKPTVTEYTKYLSTDLKNSGIELFSLQKNNDIDLIIYKCGIILGEYYTNIKEENLVVKSHKLINIKPSETLAESLAITLKDIQANNKLKSVIVED